MLKLGYKASAEQFAPRQLLDFSVLAEEGGFESVFISASIPISCAAIFAR